MMLPNEGSIVEKSYHSTAQQAGAQMTRGVHAIQDSHRAQPSSDVISLNNLAQSKLCSYFHD